jgi:pyruvate carboxylase subunit B
MMDKFREAVGPDVNLQTLARGINVVRLSQQPKDIIKMHAELFKKHGVTTIRNFDALNDIRNLDYSGKCIHEAGLKHQIAISLMGLPPDTPSEGAHSPDFIWKKSKRLSNRIFLMIRSCSKMRVAPARPEQFMKPSKKPEMLLG